MNGFINCINDRSSHGRSTANANQATFDVSKEEEKYSVVEDAAPPSTDQLEKDFYVLYKCTHLGQSATAANSSVLSLSHSSTPTPTPTTPTSPDHSNLSSHSAHYASPVSAAHSSGAGAGTGASVRYRLGRIVDVKEKLKSFLVQPVCLASGSAQMGEISTNDLISAEWVKRPNLRLITPPWYAEFRSELGLKSSREMQLGMLIPPPPSPSTQPSTPSHLAHQKRPSQHKPLSLVQSDTGLFS